MTGFEIFFAILKAIPILKEMWDKAVAKWIAIEYQNMKDANREGIRMAIYEHDQRGIEKAIGSSKAGLPSGLSGATFHDSLPGLSNKRQD